jgi:hypothetical protein
MRQRALPPSVALAFVLLAACASSGARAQFPTHFTNLQILPKEIPKEELLKVMRGWTEALGVRCTYCHAGPDNLDEMDFKTDSKMEKRVARQMLKMVQAINKDYIATLPVDMMERDRVSCYTCHHGQATPPLNLRETLSRMAAENGADEAIEHYQSQRKAHLDDGTQDFRERTLSAVASSLAQDGKLAEALKVAEANRQIFPSSSAVHTLIGHILMSKGDRAGAAASFQKAVDLDPKNEEAKQGLAQSQAQVDKP